MGAGGQVEEIIYSESAGTHEALQALLVGHRHPSSSQDFSDQLGLAIVLWLHELFVAREASVKGLARPRPLVLRVRAVPACVVCDIVYGTEREGEQAANASADRPEARALPCLQGPHDCTSRKCKVPTSQVHQRLIAPGPGRQALYARIDAGRLATRAPCRFRARTRATDRPRP